MLSKTNSGPGTEVVLWYNQDDLRIGEAGTVTLAEWLPLLSALKELHLVNSAICPRTRCLSPVLIWRMASPGAQCDLGYGSQAALCCTTAVYGPTLTRPKQVLLAATAPRARWYWQNVRYCHAWY
eukprot:1523798-Rhodomonas_salina.2